MISFALRIYYIVETEMSLAKIANEFIAKNDRSKKFWNPSIEIPNAATGTNCAVSSTTVNISICTERNLVEAK